MQRNFIALKNLSPRPDLNPCPLGPVAITLTTTRLRQMKIHVLMFKTLKQNIIMHTIMYPVELPVHTRDGQLLLPGARRVILMRLWAAQFHKKNYYILN
jgi:hypothetical protein